MRTDSVGRRRLGEMVQVCRQVVAGQIEFVTSLRRLVTLCTNAEIEDDDAVAEIEHFAGETDTHPIGELRNKYAPAYLAQLDTDLVHYQAKVGPRLLEVCKELIDRYERLAEEPATSPYKVGDEYETRIFRDILEIAQSIVDGAVAPADGCPRMDALTYHLALNEHAEFGAIHALASAIQRNVENLDDLTSAFAADCAQLITRYARHDRKRFPAESKDLGIQTLDLGPQDHIMSCSANLRVTGLRADARGVGDILKLVPTREYAKGEEYEVKRTACRSAGPSGLWALSTEGFISKSPEEHCQRLLGWLRGHEAEVATLISEPQTRVSITIVFFSGFGHGGLNLASETNAALMTYCEDLEIHFT